MIRVVIPEPIPSLNKGEAAILEGIYESLNQYGDFSITVYSPSDWIDDERRNYEGKYRVVTGVDLYDLSNNFSENPVCHGRSYFFRTWGKLFTYSLIAKFSKGIADFIFKDELLAALGDTDMILACHDGMFSYEQFWLVLAARIMGKPIALFGGGNDGKGRDKRRIRMFFQFAVNNALLCTVRDQGTRNYLLANEIEESKVHLFPDPAVMLKPCSDKRVAEILALESIPHREDKPLYGLIPVQGGIVFEKSFSTEKDLGKKHQRRVDFWANMLLHLLETTDSHFVFIPHCIGPTFKNDDRPMSRDVYEALPRGKDRFTLIENEYSAGELKGLIGKCAFVLGERAHGLIGAVSMATPCIALTVEEDMRMHNIINRMFKRKTFNLNNPDINEAKTLLSDEWHIRDKTRREMIKDAARIHERAQQAAKLFTDRAHKALGEK